MNKRALVLFNGVPCGYLSSNDDCFEFIYIDGYLSSVDARAVSLSLPLRAEPYTSPSLFPFFDGLIPEGWLLDVLVRKNDVNPLDRYELLMLSGMDTIGAVSVRRIDS